MTEPHAPAVTQELCDAFAAAEASILARRASEIPQEAVDAFVALGWMRRNGGSLHVTPLGQMALVRIRARFTDAVA